MRQHGMLQPLSTDPTLLLFIAATFLLAGFVKGVIGLGLPTIAVGVLGVVMAPAQAAALLAVPNLVTNGWQLATGPGLRRILSRLWPMLAGIVAGTWLGAGLIEQQKNGSATFWLGIALVLYGLVGLKAAKLRVPAGAEGWLGPLVGLATGLATAATGVFVLPAVPYLQALGLKKDDLVQALGMSFTTSTIALALGLASQAVWQGDQFVLSVMAVAPALAGMRAGHYLRRAISPQTFRRWFLIMLALLGAEMLLRGIV